MIEKIPFTEMAPPKREHRLVITARWNPINYHYCEHPRCNWPDAEEISECPVCGQWMCEDCFGENGALVALDKMLMGPARFAIPCCHDCSKLTSDERRTVMDLRKQMESGVQG